MTLNDYIQQAQEEWYEYVINSGEIPYKEALAYCGDLKPEYIIPIDQPLTFKGKGEYQGFELVKEL